KPMTTTVEDAVDLVQAVRRSGLVFGLTHNYTGYPPVRQAREMVAAGELGTIRVVQAEYVQDWLSTKLEDTGHKQAGWRVDPRRAGAGGCLGDIGTHAYHLVDFVTGLHARELAADLGRFVEGRMLDDNAHILLRYEGGVRGMLWASQVAPGNENGLRLRVYGDKAGLEWSQEHPNQLRFAPVGRPPQVMSRGGPCLGAAAAHATRIPAGHPEGYLEGFANLYHDLAEQIRARRAKRAPDPRAREGPGEARRARDRRGDIFGATGAAHPVDRASESAHPWRGARLRGRDQLLRVGLEGDVGPPRSALGPVHSAGAVGHSEPPLAARGAAQSVAHRRPQAVRAVGAKGGGPVLTHEPVHERRRVLRVEPAPGAVGCQQVALVKHVVGELHEKQRPHAHPSHEEPSRFFPLGIAHPAVRCHERIELPVEFVQQGTDRRGPAAP